MAARANNQKRAEMHRLHGRGMDVPEMAKRLRVSQSTVYRWLRCPVMIGVDR